MNKFFKWTRNNYLAVQVRWIIYKAKQRRENYGWDNRRD